MAKRYHQTKEDRMHESKGMRHHEEHYAGHEHRRRKEMEDMGMIHENHSAIANMPQEVMIKPYPKSGGYMPEVLDDTIRGVDRQINLDDSIARKDFAPKKV